MMADREVAYGQSQTHEYELISWKQLHTIPDQTTTIMEKRGIVGLADIYLRLLIIIVIRSS